MAHHSKNPALQGVQWRFLSKDVASGALVQSESEFDQPMTEEAQRRIAHLEQALASTQDLEAEYQTFLREAGKLAPGGGSVPTPVLSPRVRRARVLERLAGRPAQLGDAGLDRRSEVRGRGRRRRRRRWAEHGAAIGQLRRAADRRPAKIGAREYRK